MKRRSRSVLSSGARGVLALWRWFTEQWRELDRGMEDMRDLSSRPDGRDRARFIPMAPAIEVFSERDDLVIRVELVGLQPDEVDLTFVDGVLTISGQRKEDPIEESERRYYVRESRYGPFRRTITMPEALPETSEMRTSFEHGVLEVAIGGATAAAGQIRVEPSIPVRS